MQARRPLDADERADIRAAYAAGGLSMRELAARHHVSQTTIFNVLHRTEIPA